MGVESQKPAPLDRGPPLRSRALEIENLGVCFAGVIGNSDRLESGDNCA